MEGSPNISVFFHFGYFWGTNSKNIILGSIFVTMNWEPIFVSCNDWIKVVM